MFVIIGLFILLLVRFLVISNSFLHLIVIRHSFIKYIGSSRLLCFSPSIFSFSHHCNKFLILWEKCSLGIFLLLFVLYLLVKIFISFIHERVKNLVVFHRKDILETCVVSLIQSHKSYYRSPVHLKNTADKVVKIGTHDRFVFVVNTLFLLQVLLPILSCKNNAVVVNERLNREDPLCWA